MQLVYVVVAARQRFGLLASYIVEQLRLPRCCSSSLIFKVDGDTCQHHVFFGEEHLQLEDDVQVNVKIPLAAFLPLPHLHHSERKRKSILAEKGERRGKKGKERQQPCGVSAVPLADGSFLVLDD